MSYDKNKTLNYNYQNKPYKYTNLLEKLDNKFINNPNYSMEKICYRKKNIIIIIKLKNLIILEEILL